MPADKPKALDLFCKAGGATKGLQSAGFYVVGVDVEPQPRYCGDEFIQGDALTVDLSGYDFIWASPPFQANVNGFNAINKRLGRSKEHKDLIPQMRARLIENGTPYIIENVQNAHLHFPVRLCGSSFKLPIRRHRYFESSLGLMVWPCDHGWQREKKYPSASQPLPSGEKRLSTVVQVYGNGRTKGDTQNWPAALGIDWMAVFELAQAIPPTYSEFLGRQVMAYLSAESERVA